MRLARQNQGSLCLFYEKVLSVKKAPKRKTNGFQFHRSHCAREKMLPLLFSVCLILFCWLILLVSVFYAQNFFVKK